MNATKNSNGMYDISNVTDELVIGEIVIIEDVEYVVLGVFNDGTAEASAL